MTKSYFTGIAHIEGHANSDAMTKPWILMSMRPSRLARSEYDHDGHLAETQNMTAAVEEDSTYSNLILLIHQAENQDLTSSAQ
jgi:hypothetical protein